MTDVPTTPGAELGREKQVQRAPLTESRLSGLLTVVLAVLCLVLAFGGLLQAVGRHAWLTALCQAVLLYWLILPQGVLF